MIIENIEVLGYRGFSLPGKLLLAKPVADKPGSGLTVLVGPNSAGKSTIVEAFRALGNANAQSFPQGRRNHRSGDKISLKLQFADNQTIELRTVVKGGSETEWVPPNPKRPKIYAVPSRRYFSPYFNKSKYEREHVSTSSTVASFRGSNLDYFPSRLFRIQEHRAEFDKVLAKVLNPLPDWTIDQNDQGQHFIKVNTSGAFHNSEGLGEGYISLFSIIDSLYDSKPGDLVVIDEPELSLHPAFQRRLLKLIKEYASTIQIVCSTHSPYFIDFDSVLNGGSVARVVAGDEGSEIFQLNPKQISPIKGLMDNLNNPHILSLNASEVFFLEDQVVLVEGQEDVLLYKKIENLINIQLDGNYYGWGVGGADNMAIIASLLSNLGFKKVCGILDKDKKLVRDKLNKEFPSYKFHSIPAQDVRTKKSCPSKDAVLGLLDEKQELRDAFKKDIEGMFISINKYLGLD